MLRLTKQTDYGIILLVRIAEADPRVATARGLAESTRIPLPMVRKILKVLSKAGLLVSTRGIAGGYTLVRPASAIDLTEVVGALEGGIALTECCDADGNACEIKVICPSCTTWNRINQAVVGALRGVKLSELAAPARGAKSARAAAPGVTAIVEG